MEFLDTCVSVLCCTEIPDTSLLLTSLHFLQTNCIKPLYEHGDISEGTQRCSHLTPHTPISISLFPLPKLGPSKTPHLHLQWLFLSPSVPFIPTAFLCENALNDWIICFQTTCCAVACLTGALGALQFAPHTWQSQGALSREGSGNKTPFLVSLGMFPPKKTCRLLSIVSGLWSWGRGKLFIVMTQPNWCSPFYFFLNSQSMPLFEEIRQSQSFKVAFIGPLSFPTVP